MSDVEKTDVINFCRVCGRNTYHSVLCEHSVLSRDEYICDNDYQIVRCNGCYAITFREVFRDLENRYSGENGEEQIPTQLTLYPKPLKGHQELVGLYAVPEIVEKIYQEVLLVIKEEARVLAGLGLRATIEAICNDQQIKGKNLEERIKKLATQGLISKKDSERLHAIRFMGNDAAHDIKTPKDESIKVALQIVEYLIVSLYILEDRANANLETAISSFDEFSRMLHIKISTFTVGEEFPIRKLFGKDNRRISDSLSVFERELITRIRAGTETRLDVGKNEYDPESKKPLQYFIIKGCQQALSDITVP